MKRKYWITKNSEFLVFLTFKNSNERQTLFIRYRKDGVKLFEGIIHTFRYDKMQKNPKRNTNYILKGMGLSLIRN